MLGVDGSVYVGDGRLVYKLSDMVTSVLYRCFFVIAHALIDTATLKDYMWRKWISAFIGCLLGAKPLSEPMLGYCQLDP